MSRYRTIIPSSGGSHTSVPSRTSISTASSYGNTFPSKPEVAGPGLWLAIHLMASNIKNDLDKTAFIKFMKILASNLPCPACRQHMTQYLIDNPLEIHFDVDDGFFIYSINFHNYVNRRLGKPLMEYEEAVAIYRKEPDQVCTINCGDEDQPASVESQPSYNFTPIQHPSVEKVREEPLKEQHMSSDPRYYPGYNAGYSSGYPSGYPSGYSPGYQSGYSSGYPSGYPSGYSTGYSARQRPYSGYPSRNRYYRYVQ